jgi:hypothetical protein
MPIPSSTRKDYGDALASPGILQPSGQIHIDAFGLAQAQLTFALDGDAGNLTDAIDTVSMGVDYPEDLGFPMKSYKYAIASAKGGVSMMTIDYMGVTRGIGHTDAQISGVANTSSQPIETHPNFTAHDTRWVSGPLAGSPGDGGIHLTAANHPIFVKQSTDNGDGTVGETWKFNGFGFPKGEVNPKGGVRQFLRPQGNIRGTMFFNDAHKDAAFAMFNSIGKIVNTADIDTLVSPFSLADFSSAQQLLFTSVQVETIGTPTNVAGVKVVYDILVGGEDGWDLDIYLTSDQIF